MFDMGFEPQITRIIQNIRPDRQTVLFSATFPRQVEALAKRILTRPLEIVVGGRSIVCSDVDQHVEVVLEDLKFKRLLELIQEWNEKGLILVFVDTQESCDRLYNELLRLGYQVLALHGGKEQQERDFTIDDFKRKVKNIMIATSVAARGLDVRDLNLVVNYDVPNHYEDYVHRVGRTGRAGNKGSAYTFITPEEEKYAPDIHRALELSKATIPNDLALMVQEVQTKKKQGFVVPTPGSGYGGKGFKFDEAEARKKAEERKLQKLAYGEEVSDEEEEEIFDSDAENEEVPPLPTREPEVAPIVPEEVVLGVDKDKEKEKPTSTKTAAEEAMAQVLAGKHLTFAPNLNQAKQRIQAFVEALNAKQTVVKQPPPVDRLADEIEINDYPQQARWKVTHKDALSAITEWTGAAITTKGVYVPLGRNPPPGERKLHLLIEGPDQNAIKKAKVEIKRILEEACQFAVPEKFSGRYSVL
jgi:ATP-dependent RNA helicase DDX46/PRP5